MNPNHITRHTFSSPVKTWHLNNVYLCAETFFNVSNSLKIDLITVSIVWIQNRSEKKVNANITAHCAVELEGHVIWAFQHSHKKRGTKPHHICLDSLEPASDLEGQKQTKASEKTFLSEQFQIHENTFRVSVIGHTIKTGPLKGRSDCVRITNNFRQKVWGYLSKLNNKSWGWIVR